LSTASKFKYQTSNIKHQKSAKLQVPKEFEANKKRNFTAEYADYGETDLNKEKMTHARDAKSIKGRGHREGNHERHEKTRMKRTVYREASKERTSSFDKSRAGFNIEVKTGGKRCGIANEWKEGNLETTQKWN
jgi:hypothetical protein